MSDLPMLTAEMAVRLIGDDRPNGSGYVRFDHYLREDERAALMAIVKGRAVVVPAGAPAASAGSMFPGLKAGHQKITLECRFNRGPEGAFTEASERLRATFNDLLPHPANEDATYHLILTVEQDADALKRAAPPAQPAPPQEKP